MQYRAVVCDDEVYIANSTSMLLRTQTDWEMDVQHCYSPREALMLVEQARVDLLIADIRMPGISGLDVMRRTISLWPMCQVVLLTAHSEFDYVYDAIQHDNVSYVLKNEGHTALLAAVKRSMDRLENSLRQDQVLTQAREAAQAAQPYLQRELIRDLIHGVPYSREQWERLRARLPLPVDLSRPMSMWLLLLQAYGDDDTFMERSDRMQMVIGASRQYMPEGFRLFSAQLDHQRILCLGQTAEHAAIPAQHLEGFLESLQQASADRLVIPFSAVYTDDVPDYTYLKARYEALRLTQVSMAIGDQGAWLLKMEPDAPLPEPQGLTDNQYQARARVWRHAFENGDPSAGAQLDALLAPIRLSTSLEDPAVLEMYLHLALQVSAILRGGKPVHPAAGLLSARLLNAGEYKTGAQAADYLAAAIAAIRGQRLENTTTSAQEIVAKVTAYIGEHLSEDISLVRLADHVGINASYLSRVFRRATGETLIGYITALKMDEAYRLLQMPEMRIGQISQTLGFLNPAYFSFFFKKNAGITPSEYRDRRGDGRAPHGGSN